MIAEKNINLYKSLFRGRTDIYAVRWEKDVRSAYMPAYKVDWIDYNKHKAQGGTFKDYKNKEYLPFDNSAIKSHFSGKETCGIYPLLEDNTSYFIAVDFDKKNGSIKNTKYQIINNISQRTATRELKDLVEKSIFTLTGIGAGAIHIIKNQK